MFKKIALGTINVDTQTQANLCLSDVNTEHSFSLNKI